MKIIASIAGFTGSPTTLAAFFDSETNVIAVAKQIEFREERPEGYGMVTNLDLDAVDFKFTDKVMQDAIRSYYTRKAQGTLDIVDALQRFHPDNRIEQDEIGETGRRFRISPDIDNGQIAVLAICAFVDTQSSIRGALDAMNDLNEFYGIMTI
jgi:hypothetical protein